MPVSSGQITIVDYNDAPILTPNVKIGAGQIYQTYNVDSGSYTNGTSWDTTVNSGVNLQLVPELFLGTTTGPVEVCANVSYTVTTAWYVQIAGTEYEICNHAGTLTATAGGSPAGTFAYIDGAKFGRAGIKVTKNFLGNTAAKAVVFRAESKYTDSATSLLNAFNATSPAKVFVGQRGVVGISLTPSKTAFSNVALNENDTLTITAVLMRGSTPDTVNVTYKWYIDDGVTDITVAPPAGISFSANKDVITISAKNVDNLTTFKCSAQDAVEDGTNWYTDAITIADVTDPYVVDIVSTLGTTLKRGDMTATTITAELVQNGYPIDIATSLPRASAITYKWSKLGKTGSAELFKTSGGAGVYSQCCYGNASSNNQTLYLTTTAGSTAAVLSGTCIDRGLTGAGLVLAGANTTKLFSCPLIATGITIAAGSAATGTAPGMTTAITLSAAALLTGTEPVEAMLVSGLKATMTVGVSTATVPAGLTTDCLMIGDSLTNTTAFGANGSTVNSITNATTFVASMNALAAISSALVVAKTNDRWSTNSKGSMTADPTDITAGNAKLICKVIF